VKALALLFVPLVLAVPLASAQETLGTIKVTVKQLEGGFRSTTITDPEKHTAEETVTYNDGKDAVGRTIPGKVLKKTVYQLGEDGLSVSATFYDGKGKVIYKASYTRRLGACHGSRLQFAGRPLPRQARVCLHGRPHGSCLAGHRLRCQWAAHCPSPAGWAEIRKEAQVSFSSRPARG